MKQYTKREWEEILLPSEYEALTERFIYIPDNYILSASQILDMIVDYQGGISSGYKIRSLVSRVYGVELE